MKKTNTQDPFGASAKIQVYSTTGEPDKSELDMNIAKLEFFKSRLDDIKGKDEGAEYLRELISGNIEGIRSQMYNTATN